jgi:hypothetical protein
MCQNLFFSSVIVLMMEFRFWISTDVFVTVVTTERSRCVYIPVGTFKFQDMCSSFYSAHVQNLKFLPQKLASQAHAHCFGCSSLWKESLRVACCCVRSTLKETLKKLSMMHFDVWKDEASKTHDAVWLSIREMFGKYFFLQVFCVRRLKHHVRQIAWWMVRLIKPKPSSPYQTDLPPDTSSVQKFSRHPGRVLPISQRIQQKTVWIANPDLTESTKFLKFSMNSTEFWNPGLFAQACRWLRYHTE